MGLINIASSNSILRGLEYYKDKKVTEYIKINNYEYEGKVIGNNNKKYNTTINIEHPRKSTCNCLHAKDKRVICKHMIALYFTVLPKEANLFLKEVDKAEQQYNEYKEITYKKLLKYINKLSKEELQEAILELLETSPEWVYNKFIKDRVE